MADAPLAIDLRRHRDMEGRTLDQWVVRLGLVVFAALTLAALLNVFGQRPETQFAAAPAATMKIYGTDRLRGGIFYEVRFTIDARESLKNAYLVVDPGWLEGTQLNSIYPTPLGDASRDGKIGWQLGHIPAHQTYILFTQWQVEPTNVGERSENAYLYDGDRRLLTVHRRVTIFP